MIDFGYPVKEGTRNINFGRKSVEFGGRMSLDESPREKHVQGGLKKFKGRLRGLTGSKGGEKALGEKHCSNYPAS